MARGKCMFKQSDVTKAVKATIAAGLEVTRVEIDREGKIVVVTQQPGAVSNDAARTGWEDA